MRAGVAGVYLSGCVCVLRSGWGWSINVFHREGSVLNKLEHSSSDSNFFYLGHSFPRSQIKIRPRFQLLLAGINISHIYTVFSRTVDAYMKFNIALER